MPFLPHHVRSFAAVRPRPLTELTFACPACGGDRRGVVGSGPVWLHLGRLPLVPVGRHPGSVRCTSCHEEHPTEVLANLTAAAFATLLVDAVHVLTVMTVRTGDATDPRVRAAAVRHIRTVLPDYDQRRLDRDLAVIAPIDAEHRVAPLAGELHPAGCERMLSGLVEVALAAHEITAHQRWLFEAIAAAWSITPVHLGGIISALAAAGADDPEGLGPSERR